MAFILDIDGRRHELRILARWPSLIVEIDGRRHRVDGTPGEGDGAGCVRIDGAVLSFARVSTGSSQIVRLPGTTSTVHLVDPRAAASSALGNDDIRAPMPGAVVAVSRQAGEAVLRGETVLTIESMKLQTALAAPRDGVIAEIVRPVGETFGQHDVLARLEPSTESEA